MSTNAQAKSPSRKPVLAPTPPPAVALPLPSTLPHIVENGIPVKMPSGAVFNVLTAGEAEGLTERVRAYSDAFHFSNVSDLASLDLILQLETLCNRASTYLSLEKDYDNNVLLNPGSLRRVLANMSGELRQLKESVGVNKKTRDSDAATDIAAYIEGLRTRAREFGIMRDEQTAKAVELAQLLTAMYELWQRCDEQERQMNHVTPDDFLQWVGDFFVPQFQAVDEHFRKVNQRMWIQAGGV